MAARFECSTLLISISPRKEVIQMVATKAKPNANVEVTSTQLLSELQEIKDRVGALENVAGIANQPALEKYFREVLSTPQRKSLMATMQTPKTKLELQQECDHKSGPALKYHLDPLREGLVHVKHDEDGVERFEWSLLFKRMPKKIRLALIAEENGKEKG
jgi:hypothetical protein